MTTNSFDIVGFDLDGTLVDSSADLTAAVNHTLAFAERELLTIEQVKTMVGGGAKHMLAQGLDASGGCTPEEFRPLYKRMLGYYAEHISVHTRLFPGALTALDRLDALGIKSAIVTNKFESFALKLLGDLGLTERFACIIGGDTMGPGLSKPHRAPIDEMIRRCSVGGRRRKSRIRRRLDLRHHGGEECGYSRHRGQLRLPARTGSRRWVRTRSSTRSMNSFRRWSGYQPADGPAPPLRHFVHKCLASIAGGIRSQCERI